jgi:hypothetical protein
VKKYLQKIAASEEEDRTMLIISSPIVISEIKNRSRTVGYKVEPWLKTSKDDMFIINLSDVLTLSESSDIEMIMMYQSYVRQSSREENNQTKNESQNGIRI